MPIRFLTLVLILAVMAPGLALPSSTVTGRHPPILRKYFERQYYENVHGARFAVGLPPILTAAELPLMEKWITKLMEGYLGELSDTLSSLKEEVKQVRSYRPQVSAMAADSQLKEKASWKQSLAGIEDHAKHLRKMLSSVLVGLETKSNFTPFIDDAGASSGFQNEMAFIEEEIKKASQRITDYFFIPTHSVRIEDLIGENVMIILHRVQQMSRALMKKIESG
jgi:hypothetical protein